MRRRLPRSLRGLLVAFRRRVLECAALDRLVPGGRPLRARPRFLQRAALDRVVAPLLVDRRCHSSPSLRLENRMRNPEYQ